MVRIFLVLSAIFFIVILIWKIHAFSAITGLYKDEFTPAHLFNIENPNEIYEVVLNKNSNIYGLYPLNSLSSSISKDYAAYISSSPVNLDQFVNKKVKVTGIFILKNSILRAPHNTLVTYSTKTESVSLTSIRLAQ